MAATYVVYELKQEELDRIQRTRVVSIPDEDELYFGRDKIAVTDLPARTAELIQNEGAGKMIYISPCGSVKQSTVTAEIALIQRAGHDNIGLATEIKDGKRFGAVETAIRVSTLPCDQSRQPGIPRVTIDVEDHDTHVIRLNDRRIEADNLFADLKQALSGKEEKVVYLRAHKGLEYLTVTNILVLIKRAGASKIEFENECDSGAHSAGIIPGHK